MDSIPEKKTDWQTMATDMLAEELLEAEKQLADSRAERDTLRELLSEALGGLHRLTKKCDQLQADNRALRGRLRSLSANGTETRLGRAA